MTWKPELDDLARREAFAREMGGVDKVKRQHDQGRLTVRERIDGLVDHRQLPRDRRDFRGRRIQRERRTHQSDAGELRVRPRQDRRPAGGRGRRRFHGARRFGRCVDLGEAADGRGDGARLPAADHPRHRRLRRRRLGEDHRDQGRGQSAGRRRRHALVLVHDRESGPRAGGRRSGSARSRVSALRGLPPAIIP